MTSMWLSQKKHGTIRLELILEKCKLLGLGTSIEEQVFEGIPRVLENEGSIVLGMPVGSAPNGAVTLLKSTLAKFLLLRACFGASR